jgi:transcriptional regulator with XRE-family HTH domain
LRSRLRFGPLHLSPDIKLGIIFLVTGARILRGARRRAGLSQRDLARLAGVPQSHIAKIESGAVIPRVDTLDALLAACGHALEGVPRPGRGVDRTVMRELIKLRPRERGRLAVTEAANLERALPRSAR